MADDIDEPPGSGTDAETVYESGDYRPPADPEDQDPLDGDPHLPESGTRVAVTPGVAAVVEELRRRLSLFDTEDE